MKYYTYLVKFKPTNQFYYGVRYGTRCDPSDLFVTYFTSSKIIKILLETYGIDSFEYEVRKTFDDPKKAYNWEQKVLRRMKVIHNPLWFNKRSGHYDIKFPFTKTAVTLETRQKISNTMTGKKRGPHSPETIAKISESNKKVIRRKWTALEKEIQSERMKAIWERRRS